MTHSQNRQTISFLDQNAVKNKLINNKMRIVIPQLNLKQKIYETQKGHKSGYHHLKITGKVKD